MIRLVADGKFTWQTLLHAFFCSLLLTPVLVDRNFPVPTLALKLL